MHWAKIACGSFADGSQRAQANRAHCSRGSAPERDTVMEDGLAEIDQTLTHHVGEVGGLPELRAGEIEPVAEVDGLQLRGGLRRRLVITGGGRTDADWPMEATPHGDEAVVETGRLKRNLFPELGQLRGVEAAPELTALGGKPSCQLGPGQVDGADLAVSETDGVESAFTPQPTRYVSRGEMNAQPVLESERSMEMTDLRQDQHRRLCGTVRAPNHHVIVSMDIAETRHPDPLKVQFRLASQLQIRSEHQPAELSRDRKFLDRELLDFRCWPPARAFSIVRNRLSSWQFVIRRASVTSLIEFEVNSQSFKRIPSA